MTYYILNVYIINPNAVLYRDMEMAIEVDDSGKITYYYFMEDIISRIMVVDLWIWLVKLKKYLSIRHGTE